MGGSWPGLLTVVEPKILSRKIINISDTVSQNDEFLYYILYYMYYNYVTMRFFLFIYLSADLGSGLNTLDVIVSDDFSFFISIPRETRETVTFYTTSWARRSAWETTR